MQVPRAKAVNSGKRRLRIQEDPMLQQPSPLPCTQYTYHVSRPLESLERLDFKGEVPQQSQAISMYNSGDSTFHPCSSLTEVAGRIFYGNHSSSMPRIVNSLRAISKFFTRSARSSEMLGPTRVKIIFRRPHGDHLAQGPTRAAELNDPPNGTSNPEPYLRVYEFGPLLWCEQTQ